ncbi:MAG TPA: amidohydrolase family protein [Bryobacteraceae bacterium]|jgi:dihydroorotase/N-acyl-D-amino-acid deacylase|nr:amidohydrolase family protein [Bryobacteraceae bacterium]
MLLLQNGLVFDGSGNPAEPASLWMDGDRIAAPAAPPPDCEVVNCSGLAIAPGFIDLHSHLDLQVLEDRTEKVRQGVTSEVVGNCGFSPFPFDGNPARLQEFASGILGRPDGWGWSTAAQYLDTVEKCSTKMHVYPLAGHGSLRVAVSGQQQRPLTGAELDRLSGMLDDALSAGCAGFSTGLMYAPGSSAATGELEHLCRIVAAKGKLYATHMRSYAAGLLDAVREQLHLARATGCRLQISHLQAAGRGNWNLQQRALEEIENARAEGIDVEFDIYPYQCGSTVLTQWLPDWALAGGKGALLDRLRAPGTRHRIAGEMDRSRAQLWSDITLSGLSSEKNAGLVGKTIAAVAEERGAGPAETALDLLLEEEAAVNVISFNQSEENLRQLITHPLCSIISDGFYVKGKAHPRLYGTFPELLGAVTRERGWLSLPESVHKITGKPAQRLKLRDRGLLKPGYLADVTIFDPAAVASNSTYENPDQVPRGIVTVIKDGRVVYGSIPRGGAAA